MRRYFILFLAVLVSLTACGEVVVAKQLPEAVVVDHVSGIKIGSARFGWTLYNDQWKPFQLTSANFVLDTEKSLVDTSQVISDGIWTVSENGYKIKYHNEVKGLDSDKFSFSTTFNMDTLVKTKCLTLMTQFKPGQVINILADEKAVLIPEKFKKRSLKYSKAVKKLSFENDGRRITFKGKFGLVVQDNRKWDDYIQIRILPSPNSGNVSVTKLDLEVKINKTVCRVAGEEWQPVEFSGKIIPGSPIDFSSRLDKPAGKYGPVIIGKEGHFVFLNAPDKRIRFFGTNLVSTANFLTRELADEFVQKVTALGYNSVRFHHFENGLLDPKAKDSLTFNPEAVDQINYLFAKLKENGVYITIDLFASRHLKDGDNIEELKGLKYSGYEMKVLAAISPSAMANWKAFARNLLALKNPYTGLTWGEDPALFSMNLINEGPLTHLWKKYKALVPLYENKFVEYLQQRNMDTPENRSRRDGLFVEFLIALQKKCIREQMRFLKEELKVKALVTDINYSNRFFLAPLRNELDFVDNHQYWDHPNFPGHGWRVPYRHYQPSAIGNYAENPRIMMSSRIFGKPYTVTEFNFCNPNIYRMEAAPLFGGYAALQDWDGIYRFAWSHHLKYMQEQHIPTGFDVVGDPQAQFIERIIHMLFIRGDVEAAEPAFAFNFKDKFLALLPEASRNSAAYPKEFTKLGLFARIGTLCGDAEWPGVAKIQALQDDWQHKQLPAKEADVLKSLQATGMITSSTGQIQLNKKAKSLLVTTPKSEVMTFSGNASGKVMKLKNADCYQTVALLSLDDKNLTDSKSLLLIQLTNLAATNQKFDDDSLTILRSFGEFPLLLEKGTVEVELDLPPGFKVEALKLDGSFNGPVSSVYKNGVLSFTANTSAKAEGVIVYHLTR